MRQMTMTTLRLLTTMTLLSLPLATQAFAQMETPVRIGPKIDPPRKTRHIAPVYPAVARAARVEGVVILEATIDRHGRVANARVLCSIPLLDQAAVDAVREWQFSPTLLNGVPVPVIMTVTVNFTLTRKGAPASPPSAAPSASPSPVAIGDVDFMKPYERTIRTHRLDRAALRRGLRDLERLLETNGANGIAAPPAAGSRCASVEGLSPVAGGDKRTPEERVVA
jgi:protein TonB